MLLEMGPDDAVDYKAREPVYRQLAGILAAPIRRGDWAPGEQMPSEARLIQEYGLSRGTVRQAIAELVREGLAVVAPQRGTFVADELPPPPKGRRGR